MELIDRAHIHHALGDAARLRMVDALSLSDRTFTELATAAGLAGNAVAHHLDVLEAAGLIARHSSEGDRRRRYISLRHDRLVGPHPAANLRPRIVLFVCTHNSARSQFAAALWRARTSGTADSAGTTPADRVHPAAISVAAEHGLDLASAAPKGLDAVEVSPDLVVSDCDRAREAGVPFDVPALHWSIPDPVAAGTTAAFHAAFADLSNRVDRLAASAH